MLKLHKTLYSDKHDLDIQITLTVKGNTARTFTLD